MGEYKRGLHNYYNAQYSVNFDIGNIGDTFKLIIDTGSGCTLLNDSRCTNENCLKRKAYNKDKSKTVKTLNKQFKINYAQGEVIMEIVSDYFYFGNQKIRQEFGLILNENDIFEKASFDGIIGLSYPELSQSTKPFFDNLMKMGILQNSIFSIYLERRYLSTNEKIRGDRLEISDEAELSHSDLGKPHNMQLINRYKYH